MLFICTANERSFAKNENEFTGGSSVEIWTVDFKTVAAKGPIEQSIRWTFADKREAQKYSVNKTYNIAAK